MTEARTWILIEDGEKGRLKLKLTRSAHGTHGRTVEIPVPKLKMPLTHGDARRYGAALHKRLCSDEDLDQAIAQILNAKVGEVWPLCFRIEVAPALEERLRWETLWVDGHDFLALKPQWPIARVVDSGDGSATRVYRAPIRVVAVMSALGVSALQDWQGIEDAVKAAQAQGLPIHVTAIVGEQELLDHLRDLVRGQEDSDSPVWLKVVALEDQATIDEQLREPPHLLHFFCHGSLLFGDWALTLATINDRDELARSGSSSESVSVDLNHLKSLVTERDLWLVTLNCCSGGATGSTQGLAQAVVEAGAGAALGWRTPVTAADAYLLSRSVYSELFKVVQRQFAHASIDEKVKLELAGLGYALRDRLRAKHPSLLTWTLPVLYVAPDPLTIVVSSLEPDDAQNLATDHVSPGDLSNLAEASFSHTLEEFKATVPDLAELLSELVRAEVAKLADLPVVASPSSGAREQAEPAPDVLQANAWVGDSARGAQGELSADAAAWATSDPGVPVDQTHLFADTPPNAARWQEVGWGLVLPDSDGPSARDKALATDAPEPIQRLLAARPGSPVFRYRDDLGVSTLMLYESSGVAREVAVVGGEQGRREREMPAYLLIVGSPEQIPWQLQYVLNSSYCVGRLDLDDSGLSSYVDALLDDWSSSSASRRSVLTWSVDKGKDDITWTMRHGLTEPLHTSFMKDDDVPRVVHLAAGDATHTALLASLSRDHPGLIVTTSHGATPVNAPVDQLRAALGRPIDQTGASLGDDLLETWQPEGAIWYAHACCSAGADGESAYAGLLAESDLDAVLRGVSAAGSMTAPLPRRLLGCEKPLRAFVGHVEPTFSWTLRDPDTGQPLTSSLRHALYNGLYQRSGEPVGLALAKHYEAVGSLWGVWDAHRRKVNTGEAIHRRRALKARIAALDRQSIVILGDPTVTIAQD